MPLFNCSNCGVVENTALGHFWTASAESPALCSECDPRTGVWHGSFPRRFESVPVESLAHIDPRRQEHERSKRRG